ncbi:MAG TPA: SirB1 family protein [Luteimonas sp.]|nr:SirB1 family protein [Luteimonas sp.]HRP71978.1 SirB1 family protein [Luteimonas sp.]
MDVNDPLPDWRTLASMTDEALPLLDVALLIARDEYPDLDPRRYALQVQGHASHLRFAIDDESHPALKMRALNRYLFEEVGYAGNHDEYYDPRNSYLNEVFERRLGNPISLALVQMAVAREVGLPLDGVSFPGHFLVRLPVDDGMLVMDPFNRGRPLDVDELRQRARAHMGGDVPDDDALSQILHPASNRAILVRVLRNLHGLYQERGDWERATRSADRVLSLVPDNPEALRDRGLGYLELGHLVGAREDLQRYLVHHPRADDAAEVRLRLIDAGRHAARLH